MGKNYDGFFQEAFVTDDGKYIGGDTDTFRIYQSVNGAGFKAKRVFMAENALEEGSQDYESIPQKRSGYYDSRNFNTPALKVRVDSLDTVLMAVNENLKSAEQAADERDSDMPVAEIVG